MSIILLALLQVVGGIQFATNIESSQVGKSFRNPGSLHQSVDKQIPPITGEHDELKEIKGSKVYYAKEPPGHPLIGTQEQTRWPLLIAMAGVSIVSFILLAFARYFFSYERNDGSICCDSVRLAYFLTVVQAANWSAMNVTFHIASQVGLMALEALFWRSITNFLVSTFIVLFTRGDFLPVKNRFWLLVRSLCSCGSAMGLYVAIVQMELVDAVALYALVPFFALLFQYTMLGDAPGRLLLCLVTVSFFGAMLVIQPFDLFAISSSNQVRLWSSLAAIGAAACSGFGSVVVNVFARDLSANMQVLWFGALGCVIAPLIMLLQGQLPHEVTMRKVLDPEHGLLVSMSILVIGASSFLMQWAAGWSLQLHRAGHLTTVGQSSELTMQWAVGVFILNEALDPWRLCGVVIVLICGLLVVLMTRADNSEPSALDTKPAAPSSKRGNATQGSGAPVSGKTDDTD